jgi:hypothetical protein
MIGNQIARLRIGIMSAYYLGVPALFAAERYKYRVKSPNMPMIMANA